jgi:hypothetical protein
MKPPALARSRRRAHRNGANRSELLTFTVVDASRIAAAAPRLRSPLWIARSRALRRRSMTYSKDRVHACRQACSNPASRPACLLVWRCEGREWCCRRQSATPGQDPRRPIALAGRGARNIGRSGLVEGPHEAPAAIAQEAQPAKTCCTRGWATANVHASSPIRCCGNVDKRCKSAAQNNCSGLRPRAHAL